MDRQDKQSGYVVVTVAMLLVVFLGFGALATDVGILLSARTAAQAATTENNVTNSIIVHRA